MWVLGALLVAHVPVFDDSKCQALVKRPAVSQVYYARVAPGESFGVEQHCSVGDCPFAGEQLVVGAFFKDKYPTDRFSVRIGCLGCVRGVDPWDQQPPVQIEYSCRPAWTRSTPHCASSRAVSWTTS